MTIDCRGENLILHEQRAIYWPAKRMLIVSDLHIGKSAFFRKNGVPVPGTVGQTDLQRLTVLITEFHTDILIVTGDMFHNKINSDANAFRDWRAELRHLKVILIKGNHDTLKNEDYAALDIEVYQKEFLCFPFRFIHDKPNEIDEYYNISGHIHPGVAIYGRAKQQLKFPCFYFSETCAVLPAFSVFTGLYMIKPSPGDQIYAVTPRRVMQV